MLGLAVGGVAAAALLAVGVGWQVREDARIETAQQARARSLLAAAPKLTPAPEPSAEPPRLAMALDPPPSAAPPLDPAPAPAVLVAQSPDPAPDSAPALRPALR